MDNIYENAIKNIKSSLYDVMIIEQDNLNSLENKMLVSAEEEKEILKEKIALKKETLNNLRTNTQELEKNLEVLDNFDNELINNKEKVEELVNDSIENTESKEQEEKEEPVNEPIEDTEIKEQEVEEPENDSIEDTESKEQEEKEEPENDSIEDTEIKEQEEKEEPENDYIEDTESKEQEEKEPENDSIEDTEIKEKEEPENDSIEDTEIKEQEEKEEPEKKEEPENEPIEDTEIKEQEKEESENDNIKDIDIPIVNNSSESQDQNTEEVNNESKYRFIKNTNNPVKAILVTKEQEEKLSQSLEKQEYIQVVKENLKDLKPFDSNDLEQIRNQDMIENQEFQKELEKQIQKNIEAGVDKERQIEDLMVKANIYTNEGESDKAEIIYNKINELQNGSELKENPVMVKAA